jgi:hypothetical protein
MDGDRRKVKKSFSRFAEEWTSLDNATVFTELGLERKPLRWAVLGVEAVIRK